MSKQNLANVLTDSFASRSRLYRLLSLSLLFLVVSSSVKASNPEEDFPTDVPRLTSISVTAPSTVFASPNETVQLTVLGTFEDGSMQDLTAPALGTQYQSNNPLVITVNSNGLVRSLATGRAEIFVNNGTILDSLSFSVSNPLTEDCTASVLNRSVQVSADGTFAIPNVPATSGLIRIRVTCERDGKFFAGHSDLLTPIQNDDTVVGGIELQEVAPIPVNIKITSPKTTFSAPGETAQLVVTGTLPDGNLADYTARTTGATYQSSNLNLGTVTDSGFYTAFANGTVVVTVRVEGAIATIFLTNALGNDADGDGLPNDFEVQNGLNPNLAADAAQDPDGDGLSNLGEFLAGTDLRIRDTDGDGLNDGDETGRGSNPLAADTDGDGLLDRDEVLRGTDPKDRDTDGDGLSDGVEVAVGLDPRDADSDNDGTADAAEDSDGDGIRNEDEVLEFTSIGDPDTDDDGINDGEEVVVGTDGFKTDPLDADTDNDGMRDGCETGCAGLDPTNGGDAGGDLDLDGLTNLQECQGGTNPCEVDDILGPNVVTVTPLDDASGVATNSDVVLVFDEPVNPSTVIAANFILFAGTTRLTPSLLRSADNMTITLRTGLQAGTIHSVFVTSRITDVQGNRGREFSSTFTTGDPPDSTRPGVAAVRPGSGASGVSVSKCVTVFFSEPISPTTVTADSFKLATGGTAVASTTIVDPEGTSAALCPDAPLAFNTTYTVSATTAIEDAAGNDLQSFSASFTTAQDPAATRPSVVSIRPSSGQTGVPTNAPVLALFSEPVVPATVTGTSFRVRVGGVDVAGAITLEEGNTVARFTPSAPYFASTAVNVQLLNTIADPAGNTLLNPQNFNFTAGTAADTTAPAVQAVSPVAGSAGLGTNALVMARFSEALNSVSVNAGSFRVSDDEGALVPCTITFSRGDSVVTFTPQEPLDSSTLHTLAISTRVIDLGGNSVPASSITFTTGSGADVEFPRVLSINPVDNAAGVPVNTRVAILFSRPLNPVTIDSTSFPIQGASPVPGSFSTNTARTVVFFDPASDLQSSRSHSVRGLRQEVLDDNGNRLNGGASDFFSNFTTGDSTDITGPQVLSVNPPNGLLGVGANAPLTLLFTEPIDVTSIGPSSLRIARGGVPVEGTYSPSTDLTAITFRPLAMLAVNSLYTVDLTGGAYFDVAGNGGSAFTSTFTTGGSVDLDFPVVTRVSPANGADNVPTSSVVVVELSEPVNQILLNEANFLVTASGFGTVPGTRSVSADRRRVTFTPMMPYPVSGFITVRLRRDVTDDAGNRLQNGADFNSSFTTEYLTDSSPPAVASTSPANGDVLVPLNAEIQVELSEPIDTTTITPAAFAVSAAGQQILGTFSYAELNRVVVFDPDVELPASTEVQAVVAGIRDLSGNALPGALTLRFRTGSGVDSAFPDVVATNPLAGAEDVPLSPAIGFTFSESMSEVTIDASTLQITGSGAPPVVYSVTFDRATGRNASIRPDRPLLPFIRYTVRAFGTITDRAGNRLRNGSGFSFTFTTGRQGDVTGPVVVSTSPVDGATQVGANTPVVVEFDEAVDANSVNNATFLVTGDLVEILGAFEVSQDGRVASLEPFTFLRTGIEHQVRLEGIRDTSGNAMTPATFHFTTVDRGNLALTSGVLVNTSTVYSASYPGTNLIDGNLLTSWFTAVNDTAPVAEIVFLEDVTVLGVNLLNSRSNPDSYDFLSGSVQLRTGDQQVLWESGTFALDEGAFQDKSLVVPGVEGVRRVRFEGITWQGPDPALAEIQVIGRFADDSKGVPDLESPAVTGVIPAVNTPDVPVTVAPRVTFSKAMNPITFTPESFYIYSNGIGRYPAAITLDAAARVATLTPADPLPGDSLIYLYVTSNVTDANGNRVQAISSYFYTADTPDVVAPALASIDPPDGATGVRPTQTISITFSEPLNASTLRADALGVYAEGVKLQVSIQHSQDNTVVLLNANWAPGTLHLVYLTQSLTDLSGNPVAQLYSRFTTGGGLDSASPRVFAVRPPGGATDVPVGHPVHLFISEPVDPATLDSGYFLSAATNQGGKLIPGVRSLSYANQVATYQPSQPLGIGSGFVVALKPSVKDTAGNALQNFSSTFNTAEDSGTVGPLAALVTPASGSSDVPINARVRVRFTEPIDRSSITPASFFLTPSGMAVVPGAFAFEAGDTVVVFTPDAALTASKSHTLSLRTTIRDPQGSAYRFNQGFAFTTGTAADTVPPSVLLASPPNDAQSIGINAPVVVQFSEPMDPITVSASALQVSDPDGTLVPCSLFFSADNRVVTFLSQSPLAPDKVHTINITGGARDGAGNALSPTFTSTFRTAEGPVWDPPSVVRVSPENGAGGIPVNASFDLEFSKPLNPITVTEANVRITVSGFGTIPSLLSLSADRTRLTLTPNMRLPVSRSVSLRAERFLTDDHGNELTGGSTFFASFTTEFLPDALAPTLIAVSPPHGAINAALNTQVLLELSEPMDIVSFGGSAFMVSAGGSPLQGTVTFFAGNTLVSWDPKLPLAPSTVHTVSLAGTVRDTAGNALGAPVASTFTTGSLVDLTSPTVVEESPPSGSQGVPTDAVIRIQFSERLSPASVNVAGFSFSASSFGAWPFAVSLDGSLTVVTITPSEDLRALTSHSVSVRTSVLDLAGNPSVGAFSSFVTGGGPSSPGAPSVARVHPANGSTVLPVNANVTLELSRPMDRITFTPATFRVRVGGADVPGTYALDATLRRATFTPSAFFAAGSLVDVIASGMTDFSGTPLAPQFTSQFTVSGNGNLTQVAGVTAAASSEYSASYPAANAIDGKLSPSWFTQPPDAVNRGGSPFIEVLFPEIAAVTEIRIFGPRDAPTGNDFFSGIFRLFNAAGTQLYTSGDVALPAPERDLVLTFAEVSGVRRGRFTPTADEGSDPGIAELELIGRYSSGLPVPDRAAPLVLGTSPQLSATEVPAGSSISLTFSEPMNPFLTEAAVELSASTVGTIPGSVSWNVQRTVLTFTPSLALASGSFHSLVVRRTAVDDAGNELGGGSGYNLYFSTAAVADATPPSVVSFVPADGATDVYLNQPVTIRFSEPISHSVQLNNLIATFAEGDEVFASITRSQDDLSIILSASWPPESIVTVVVSKDLADIAGNPLGSDVYSSFMTTVAVDNANPRVQTIRPSSGASEVPVDKDLVVILSERVRAATVPGSIYLAGPDGQLFPVDVSLVGDGSILLVNPQGNLVHSGTHTLYVRQDLLDLAGNPFGNYSSSFTTVEDSSALGPRVTASQPPSGQAGVALNAAILVRFSEPVDPVTVTGTTFTVTPSGGAALTGTITMEEGNTLARLTPSANMTASRAHTIRVLTGVLDVGGAALRNAFAVGFTTGTAIDAVLPGNVATSPVAGQADVGVNAIVSVRFSEPIAPITVTRSTFRVSNAQGDRVPCDIFFEEGNLVAHLVPNDPLAPSVVHTLTLGSSIQDQAGNSLGADVSSLFTTTLGTNVNGPDVTSYSTLQSAPDVPVNVQIQALLSEPVSPVNVSTDTVTLTASGLGQVAGEVSLSADRRLITFTPDAPLTTGRFHILRLLREIRDAEGNLFRDGSGSTLSFTTGSTSDGVPPSVAAVSPENGNVLVPRNTRIAVELNEPIDLTSISQATVDLERGGIDVPGGFEPFAVDRRIYFLSTQPLVGSSAHRLTVSGVRDLAGNVMAAPFVVNFSTAGSSDLVPPQGTGVTPANGATGVSRSTTVVVTFSEPISLVNLSSSGVRLIESGVGDIATTISVAADRRTLTITPSVTLSPNKFFSVNVSSQLTDVAGNALVNFGSSFTTGP